MCLAYESLSDNFTLICLGSFLLKILRVTQKLSFAMCNAVQCRTINRRSRLTIPSMFISSMWDVKEATHYSIRVGHEVPGVVAVPCECMGGYRVGRVVNLVGDLVSYC